MYIFLVDNVVKQKQPNAQDGFVFTDQTVVCGQILENESIVDGVIISGDFVNPLVASLTKQEVIDAINVYAGETQLRIETALVSPGYGRKDQYAQSSVQVVAWRAAGSPADAVPALIVSWAEARSITNEAGATEIEGQKAYMESKVEAVFDIRVKGTEAIKALSSGYEAAAQTYYDQLDALTA